MATAADLVVLECVAGRGKDVDDVAALLSVHADVDLSRVGARVAELAALAETDEPVEVLERAVRAAGRARARS